MKGKFRPLHPEKYDGDCTQIFWRSMWECKYMSMLDKSDNVLKWSSESKIIPYLSPLDNRKHKYYVDFFVVYKDGKKELIEIKPEHQTKPPEIQKKKNKRYIKAVMTYAINHAKFLAAEQYCKKNGYIWRILTEKELGIK